MDVYRRTGGDAEAALAAVMKYHFDYSDLSKFERNVMRRVIPFYTWFSRNFPLQITNIVQQPGKYAAYTHLKHNMELGVPEDETVPSYYADLLAIRLPFSSSGSRIYATPDLPFVQLSKTLDVSQLGSQLNPVIKVPLESYTNYKLFEQRPFSATAKSAPDTWVPLLHVLKLANGKFGLPKVYTASDGTLMMDEKQANKIESLIPVLGRARRLVPSTEKEQDRAFTTWFSFVFGLGTRTLDDAAISGELLRRAEQQKRSKKLENTLSGKATQKKAS
jgi:hypothetical protein